MASCFRFQSLLHYTYHLHVDLSLRALYSAANAIVISFARKTSAKRRPKFIPEATSLWLSALVDYQKSLSTIAPAT